MSTWSAPITFASSTLTSAQMNAEVRDHANFLKGALDVISNSTSADTSDTMNLWIKRAAASGSAYSASVTADTNARLIIAANGDHTWGTGAAVGDVTLKRDTVGSLRIDGRLNAYASATNVAYSATQAGDAALRFAVLANGTLSWGDGSVTADTTLYRDGALRLRTDVALISSSTVRVESATGFISVGSGNSILRNLLVSTDAQPSFQIQHTNGAILWGTGGSSAADTNLYRSAADVLKTDDTFVAALGLATKVKAGAPVDGDWTVAPPIGTFVYDTTNSKLWVRQAAATWRGVVVA